MKTTNTATFAVAAMIATSVLWAAPNAKAESPAVGIDKRTFWTTSRITGSPDPPLPYTTQRAFPSLKFNQCLDIAKVPGGSRKAIVRRET